MFELGNVANALSGESVSNPRRRVVPKTARLPGQTAVPSDRAAVGAPGAREAQRRFNAGEPQSMSQIIKEVAAAVRAKVEKFRELVESITASRVAARILAEDLEDHAGEIGTNEISANCVYSDVSSLLDYFREAIKEIRSFEGFLIGVHKKIEKFVPHAEFDLKQVQDVEEHMADVSARLELGIFSLAHVREEALKALRCQDSPEPERALALLEDDIREPNSARQTIPGETPSCTQNGLL